MIRNLPQFDVERMSERLEAALDLPAATTFVSRLRGTVSAVGNGVVHANLKDVKLGEVCSIGVSGLQGEVVSVSNAGSVISTYAPASSVLVGDEVLPTGVPLSIDVGAHLLGQVVDGLGKPHFQMNYPTDCERRVVQRSAPRPLDRQPITEPLISGIRAIDAFLTLGKGQRIGLLAPAGGGKTTLLGMLLKDSASDVNVVALVGERGREVREFLEVVLEPKVLEKTVAVVATSDRPPAERYQAAFVATTIAEYFRDQGMSVLLAVDSITRFARAARQLAVAAGEPLTTGGFPPSVFADLARLLERAGPGAVGSITGIYTVLVEGDDIREPFTDEVISVLDGHIKLSRELAAKGHFPPIDLRSSISRLAHRVADPTLIELAVEVRGLLERYREATLLLRIGEYKRGSDLATDRAIDKKDEIDNFLKQDKPSKRKLSDLVLELRKILRT